jgi:formate/nitrite transporter
MKNNFYSPAEVARILNDGGVGKAKRGAGDLLVLGTLAGAYVAMAGLVALVVGHDAPQFFGVGAARFLIGTVFTLGLALVLLAGAELFTGNCLMSMTLLDRKITWGQMLRNWALVYFANFLGSLLVAGIVYAAQVGGMNHGLVGEYAAKVADGKMSLTFSVAFFRGIMANWLVCLAVWIAAGAKDFGSKLLGMYLPIMGFVAANFEHSVANMFFVPYGLLQQGNFDLAHLLQFLSNNLLPVTIGNIIGGAVMVGALYWYLYLRRSRA